jgi:hypothetical protein
MKMARAACVAASLVCTVAAGCGPRATHDRIAAEATPSATTTPSPSPTSSREASLPGSAWRIPRNAHGGIQGFADRTSVAPGESVGIYVSTSARTFVVHAFRMGWYRGAMGRLVWSSAAVRGRVQPKAVESPASTRTMRAPWHRSITLSTTGWLPGDYLLRLDTSTHRESYVPLTVRAPSAVGRVVLVNAVTTWQAYNAWGCCTLYKGANGSFATRSRAVSFDRPYSDEDGAGQFIERELGVVAEAERLGLPIAYATDVDLELHPSILRGAAAAVSMGHDEYWSVRMRSVVTAARDHGTNLAFFGANDVFRRIRLTSSALGPARLETNYKVASEDPATRTHPAQTTADWPASPHAQPESSLLGAQYGCFPGKTRVSGVVVDPRNWVFSGTEVAKGMQLPGLVGPEVDTVQLRYPTPRPIEVLLHSPVRCPGGSPTHQDTTYYVAKSGAGVFDAGTIDWACDVRGGCHASGPTHRVIRQVTDNVLRAFAAGPAGRAHPARDNLAALGISAH